ncbi:hypothetical protein BH11ACT8_BH11ACT8_07380 [soil metagenome]
MLEAKHPDRGEVLIVRLADGTLSLEAGLYSPWEARLSELLSEGNDVSSLRLRRLRLYDVPQCVLWVASTLRELDLSANALRDLPQWTADLGQLTRLDVSLNALRPDVFDIDGRLPSELHSLNLSGNVMLRELPALFADTQTLPNLRDLRVAECGLRDIGAALSGREGLETLDLSRNVLEGRESELALPPSIESLSLAGCRLVAVPPTIRNIHALKEIDLSGNALDDLPLWLTAMPEIESINLARNRVARMPPLGGAESNLRRLNVSSNVLAEDGTFPGSLQELIISGSPLTVLPSGVAELGALRSLVAVSCGLVSLGVGVAQLPHLEKLELANNRIAELPDDWSGARSLRHLGLQRNQITSLPRSLGALPSLESVVTRGNALVREQAAAATSNSLISYLRSLWQDQAAVNEVKLVLVGEGAVGKSSLLAALIGDPHDVHRPTTHGLEIKSFELPIDASHTSGLPLTVRAWDFGGQPQYRPAQQVFFSEDAIYLVAWRPRLGVGANAIAHWIETIRQRAGDCKIVLVATHQDVEPIHAEQGEALVADFGVSAYCGVASPTGAGIPDLKARITELALDLGTTQRTVPAAWIEARNTLITSGAPYVSFEQFEAVASAHSHSPVDARALAVTGQVLGWWVFDDTPHLSSIVVTKGDWLGAAIALVMDGERDPSGLGLVDTPTLSRLWDDPDRPAHLRYPAHLHNHFVALMEKYDLAYRAPNRVRDPDILVIPQLLSDVVPTRFVDAWVDALPNADRDERHCSTALLNGVKTSVPVGLLPRLIARTHRRSLGALELDKAVHWQAGVVLKSENARALVRPTADGISISAKGAFPTELIVEIEAALGDLVAAYWPGTTLTTQLSCPRCETARAFERDRLVERSLRHLKDAECPYCFARLDIDQIVSPAVKRQALESAMRDEFDRIADMLDRVADRQEHMVASLPNLQLALSAIAQQLHRDLAVVLDAIADEVLNGPRLFLVEEVARTASTPQVAHVRLRIRLFCEHSHRALSDLDQDPGSGVFEIDVPRKWWKRLRPILDRTRLVLGVLAPFAAAGLPMGKAEDGWIESAGEPIEFLQELSGATADAIEGFDSSGPDDDYVDDPAPNDRPSVFTPTLKEGGAMREFQRLLREHDPSLGDLRLVRSNDGYLWVHRNFEQQYRRVPG